MRGNRRTIRIWRTSSSNQRAWTTNKRYSQSIYHFTHTYVRIYSYTARVCDGGGLAGWGRGPGMCVCVCLCIYASLSPPNVCGSLSFFFAGCLPSCLFFIRIHTHTHSKHTGPQDRPCSCVGHPPTSNQQGYQDPPCIAPYTRGQCK